MKKKGYNENYFEIIDTEDKAYFLGFICADGCVLNDAKTYRYQLNLKIHKKDEHILQELLKYTNGEMEIWRHEKRNMSQIAFSGKKMIEDLEIHGVIPKKTFMVEYPQIKEDLERHFLRGYFDGDGCIRINTDKRDNSKRGDLRIVGGSMGMLNKINERMNILFGTNLNKLYGPKNKDYKFIGWAGMTDIEKIYHGFYDDSSLYLTRKKTIFDEVMTEIVNKKKYRKK